MLGKKYDSSVIGLNYLSLLFGITSLKKGNETLLIEDKDLVFNGNWSTNLGYLEIKALELLGKRYQIECLQSLDKFIDQQNTILNLNQVMIELSSSPYTNIRELARKLPTFFSDYFQKKFLSIKQEDFDRVFFKELDLLVKNSVEDSKDLEVAVFFQNSSSADLSFIFNSFREFLDQDTLITKQLHYVLQSMFQTVFSPGKDDDETCYLLSSLISPRYKFNVAKLQQELLYEFRKCGGDLTTTKIKDWGVENNVLSYLLLDSVDGIILPGQTYYFGQTNKLLPFEAKNKKTEFLSIKLVSLVEHDFLDSFKNKRIVFSRQERMGSDFPYWEVRIGDDGTLSATYAYAEYLGAKPSFYYHHALEDLFQSMTFLLPGINKADWIARANLSLGDDIWFEYGAKLKKQLSPKGKLDLKSFVLKSNGNQIEQFTHCGPSRGRSLGHFSYLLDIFPG